MEPEEKQKQQEESFIQHKEKHPTVQVGTTDKSALSYEAERSRRRRKKQKEVERRARATSNWAFLYALLLSRCGGCAYRNGFNDEQFEIERSDRRKSGGKEKKKARKRRSHVGRGQALGSESEDETRARKVCIN